MSNAVVSFTGRVPFDPKTNKTQSGSEFMSFRVDVRTSKKQPNSQYYENDPYQVSAYGKTREFLSTRLHKGDTVFVSGTQEIKTFKDKNGEMKYVMDVMANVVQIVSSAEVQEKARAQTVTQTAAAMEDSDLPF